MKTINILLILLTVSLGSCGKNESNAANGVAPTTPKQDILSPEYSELIGRTFEYNVPSTPSDPFTSGRPVPSHFYDSYSIEITDTNVIVTRTAQKWVFQRRMYGGTDSWVYDSSVITVKTYSIKYGSAKDIAVKAIIHDKDSETIELWLNFRKSVDFEDVYYMCMDSFNFEGSKCADFNEI